MDMNRSVNPVLAVVVAALVLVGVGYLSVRIFARTGGEKPVVVQPPDNPNAPQFRPDPRLGGGQ
jgi:hypothetical protein